MDVKFVKQKTFKHFFDSFAQKRIKYRRHRSYYWKSISKYCNYYIHPEHSILELGCGTGEFINEIKGVKKTGIDFSGQMIEQARRQFPDMDLHVMEAENIQLTETYDVIIMSNLLSYIEDVQCVLNQTHKACHKQTKIIITHYNHLWEPLIKFAEFTGIKKRLPPLNWLSNNDLDNFLYLSGFEKYKQSQNMLIPFNIPGISWFFNKILSKLPLFNYFALNKYIFARKAVDVSSENDRQYSCSIIIPARNESGNIEYAVKRIPEFGKHIEIIFIEGNSTDDTWEKIQEVQKKYKDSHDIKIDRQDGKGKGDAVRKGFNMASGDILMILDADLTVPPEDLPKFYNAMAGRPGDFINGSRLVYPLEKNAMRTLNLFGNKFFSVMFSWILEQPIRDTLCGTKVIFKNDYERLAANRAFFGDFDPFGDFDLIFGAYKLNLKIIDLPIRYQERKYGDTNISRFKHGMLLFRMMFFAIVKIKFW